MTFPESKPTLIYIGDPMCSWCYGVSEEMTKVKDHFEGKYEFKMVMGGLRPYNTQKMAELKDFLIHHWEDVEARSGQEFKTGILDDTNITYDTEPPCRAVVIVREINPAVAFIFFKEVQKAFYKENKNMHLAESYRDALLSLGLDFETFEKKFNSDEAKLAVKADFELASELGVQGFPTLLLENGAEITVIASGYMAGEKMIQRLEAMLVK